MDRETLAAALARSLAAGDRVALAPDAVGAARSLAADGLIALEHERRTAWALTAEGETYRREGTPEAALHALLAPGGTRKAALGSFAQLDRALGALLAAGGVRVDREAGEPLLVPLPFEDRVRAQLELVAAGTPPDARACAALKRRRLVQQRAETAVFATRGPRFGELGGGRSAAVLTAEMLADGSWRTTRFKPYNFAALGVTQPVGYTHPLLDMRERYRTLLLALGFEEMRTDRYVEASFWNFDALIQPQQHPARDMHDTFFVGGEWARAEALPADYVAAVKTMHERGGAGSLGYRYEWSEAEARRNVLRTHTTAVSARLLYAMRRAGRTEGKFFSIDRVFRNETLDATHLAEFHQVEGVVFGPGLTLCDLMHVIRVFFERLGMADVRFKPAYNPYTEPSMEIFAVHPLLGRLVEVGNSGVFRPELLAPMGFPPGTAAIAWGLSLERPTMILHAVDNIRDLVGPAVSLQMIHDAHFE